MKRESCINPEYNKYALRILFFVLWVKKEPKEGIRKKLYTKFGDGTNRTEKKIIVACQS